MSDVPQHPIQTHTRHRSGKAPQAVTLKAYEIYRHIYGEQKALIEGGCRGGFSTGELIAFLYASSFPKSEWAARAQQAFRGLEI
ncbi:MAG: hypothetical protein EOQ44_25270 [Mesorhizobium sp.]|uniref:hypothetical protein n=1 Tax=Mesorhizobium sp. TaxID=1871066 RepID=UPI000FE54626|nr:hypothetical protein [Mesorhizobium sp.]RWB40455.1 MAG: hypothetical protein EOQ44_25270 [Mesorhizobium sp.]